MIGHETPRAREERAWKLGHDAGMMGVAPRLPRHFSRDEERAYRDGWRAAGGEADVPGEAGADATLAAMAGHWTPAREAVEGRPMGWGHAFRPCVAGIDDLAGMLDDDE